MCSVEGGKVGSGFLINDWIFVFNLLFFDLVWDWSWCIIDIFWDVKLLGLDCVCNCFIIIVMDLKLFFLVIDGGESLKLCLLEFCLEIWWFL